MNDFKSSIKELKNIRSLTGASMLTALNVVIHALTTFYFDQTLRLSFTFIAVAASGMLYGPFVAGLAAVAADLLKFLIKPGGSFFIGFTFNEFLIGVIYGVFLYKKSITILRVFCAKLCEIVVINLLLTPLWLSMMYGKAFTVLLSARILKNLIELPIETIVLYFILKFIKKVIDKKQNTL